VGVWTDGLVKCGQAVIANGGALSVPINLANIDVGDVIVIAVGVTNSGGTTNQSIASITDDLGTPNTYTQQVHGTRTTSTWVMDFWTAPCTTAFSSSGGKHVNITTAGTGNDDKVAMVFKISGAHAAPFVDRTNTGSSGGPTYSMASGGTGAQADEKRR
jgi:hypothetical protein